MNAARHHAAAIRRGASGPLNLRKPLKLTPMEERKTASDHADAPRPALNPLKLLNRAPLPAALVWQHRHREQGTHRGRRVGMRPSNSALHDAPGVTARHTLDFAARLQSLQIAVVFEDADDIARHF